MHALQNAEQAHYVCAVYALNCPILQSLVGVDVDAVVSDDTLWSMITWPVSLHSTAASSSSSASKSRSTAAAAAVTTTTHAARCMANEFATITNRCVQ
jgi:hypothetical protein